MIWNKCHQEIQNTSTLLMMWVDSGGGIADKRDKLGLQIEVRAVRKAEIFHLF